MPTPPPSSRIRRAPASTTPPMRGPGPIRVVRSPQGGGTSPGSGDRSGTSTDTTRLNKRMAELGLASRREADAWIEKGWVRVDGQIAQMGMQVRADARIEVAPQARGEQARQVTVLLHKPMGLVSGQAEDGHTPAITLVQPANRWREDRTRIDFHPAQLRGLVPAGRLDVDSTGLLVLTQDGRVARTLIGEDVEPVEKEYLVRVAYTGQANRAAAHTASATYDARNRAQQRVGLSGTSPEAQGQEDVQAVFPPELLARLRHGLALDGQPLRPAQVDWQNPQQLRFVLIEGKKRQIRRMCELVGLTVLGLKRVRVGRVRLGQLPVGQWRYLGPDERF